MDVLKKKANVGIPQVNIVQVYGKVEDIQAEEVDMVFLFIPEYRNVVLSRGRQH
jgi:hypothetical protein